MQDFKSKTKNITLLEKKSKIISKDLKVKFYQLRDLKQKMLYKDWEGYNK